jgi:hypothetical protein
MLFLFLVMIFTVRCDLPVHCLAKQIQGVWDFYIYPDSSTIQLSCGHNAPDQNTG